jgi:hypothetical protein
VSRCAQSLDYSRPGAWRASKLAGIRNHPASRVDELPPGVPLAIRLDRLHLVLQTAFGGTNSQLYEFRARDVGWGEPDREFGDAPQNARTACLGEVLKDAGLRSTEYLDNFGDGWEYSARIEPVTEAEPGAIYPRLIGAAGYCPPEDIGSPWGYREFLALIADPKHERHTEFVAWIGGKFDPNAVDVERYARAVAVLAGVGRAPQRPAASDRTDRRYSPVAYTDGTTI